MTDYEYIIKEARKKKFYCEEDTINENTTVVRVYQGAYYRKNYYFNSFGGLIDVEEEQADWNGV